MEHNLYVSQQGAGCRLPITKVITVKMEATDTDWYSNDMAGQGTKHFFWVDAVTP